MRCLGMQGDESIQEPCDRRNDPNNRESDREQDQSWFQQHEKCPKEPE